MQGRGAADEILSAEGSREPAGVVEALAHVFPCGHDDKWLRGRNGLQLFHLLPFLLGAFRANKGDDIGAMRLQKFGQCRDMGGAACQDNRRTFPFQNFYDIFDDEQVSVFVFRNIFINVAEKAEFVW